MHVETSITADALGPSYAPGHYEHIDVAGNEEESVGEREHDGDSQNGGKPARVETSILFVLKEMVFACALLHINSSKIEVGENHSGS